LYITIIVVFLTAFLHVLVYLAYYAFHLHVFCYYLSFPISSVEAVSQVMHLGKLLFHSLDGTLMIR